MVEKCWAGGHLVKIIAVIMLLTYGLTQRCHAQVSVLTYHNDNLRTGANTSETILTPANVSSNIFKRLFSRGVDGYVYAQPLVAAGVNIPRAGACHVVYVATAHDGLYAFDVDPGRPFRPVRLLTKLS